MIGSSPVVGSSYSRMRGLAAMARAIATRRRWPPDSSDGMLVDELARARRSRALPRRAAATSSSGMSVSSYSL